MILYEQEGKSETTKDNLTVFQLFFWITWGFAFPFAFDHITEIPNLAQPSLILPVFESRTH